MSEELILDQMEQETEEMLRVRYLDDQNTVFERTKGGFVSLRIGEEFYPRVQVVRMFPFTDQNEFISIRTTGERSNEIGMIRDITKIKKDTADMLKEQINLKYFIPKIIKILKIKDEYGYAYWDVLTNHGECRFTIQMGQNTVNHLSDTRILIQDIDDNRFEIPDVSRLSNAERKKLDLFL